MSWDAVLMIVLALVVQNPAEERNSDIQNIGRRDINRGSLAISQERELELGRQLRTALEQKVKLVYQSEVSTYVDSIVQLLAVNSDAEIPIVSGIIESDEIDSIALPGGNVYVTTGLIRAADNEAELAAALAHAIAHVAARHAAEMAMKAELLNQASISLRMDRTANTPLSQAAASVVPAQMLAFARKNVAEADFLSLQYLYRAGWDPDAAIRFLEKMQARAVSPQAAASPFPVEVSAGRYIGASRGTGVQISQPQSPIGTRIEALQRERKMLPLRPDDRVNTAAFDRAKILVATSSR